MKAAHRRSGASGRAGGLCSCCQERAPTGLGGRPGPLSGHSVDTECDNRT